MSALNFQFIFSTSIVVCIRSFLLCHTYRKRGEEASCRPSRTKQWSRHPTASAPTSLQPLGAARRQRSATGHSQEDNMVGKFDDKVALVTGGNSGIGRAAAVAFAREGARVVIAARRVPEGEETVREIQEAGGHALFGQTDVSQGDAVAAMLQRTLDVYGRLDYAFNNAGGGVLAPFLEVTEADFDCVIGI